MTNPARRPAETDVTWAALGQQLRLYRSVLIGAVVLMGIYIISGGWAQWQAPDIAEAGSPVAASPAALNASDSLVGRPEPPGGEASARPGLLYRHGDSTRQETTIRIQESSSPDGLKTASAKSVQRQDQGERLLRQRDDSPREQARMNWSATLRRAGHRLGSSIAWWQDAAQTAWRATGGRMGSAVAARFARFFRFRQDAAHAAKHPHTDRQPRSPATSTRDSSPPEHSHIEPRAADANNREAADGDLGWATLVIANPPHSGATVRYLLEGREHMLKPGDVQRLRHGTRWRIEFHRGGPFDDAAYTLSPGAYSFRATTKGWELFSTAGEW